MARHLKGTSSRSSAVFPRVGAEGISPDTEPDLTWPARAKVCPASLI